MFLLCTLVQPQGIEPKVFSCSFDVLPLHQPGFQLLKSWQLNITYMSDWLVGWLVGWPANLLTAEYTYIHEVSCRLSNKAWFSFTCISLSSFGKNQG